MKTPIPYTVRLLAVAGASLLSLSCADGKAQYDASGTFEATEITVAAQQPGLLVALTVNEGDLLDAAVEVGLIDTTQIALKIAQAEAAKAVYQSQKPDIEKQLAATRQQLDKALVEQQRYQELVRDGAAPAKALDDATSQTQLLRRQLEALQSSLAAQTATLSRQTEAADVQIAQLRDQLRQCRIAAPTSGTVLEKYAQQGEYVTPGKPLFKMADTERMHLRAYVTTAQLEHIALGQEVTVYADYGDGSRKEYKGVVAWIASRAEFTPKTILTDDERANLAYAVKISFANDGGAKIGMYGEVKF